MDACRIYYLLASSVHLPWFFSFRVNTHLSCSFLSIVKRSFIHKLQLGFINVFISPIGLSYFTDLNAMHLSRSVRDVVDSKSKNFLYSSHVSLIASTVTYNLSEGELLICGVLVPYLALD